MDASRSLVEKKRYRRDSSSSEEGDNDGDTRENDDPEENNQVSTFVWRVFHNYRCPTLPFQADRFEKYLNAIRVSLCNIK